MGIRFSCPNGHPLNVKTFLAGKRGVCPHCGAKFVIPTDGDSVVSETEPLFAAQPSQAHEMNSPAAGQTASVIASPSIIITVADTFAASASSVPASTDAIDPPESPVSEIPPPQVAMAPQPPTAIKPAVVGPARQFVGQRKRSRRNQVILSLVLLVLVIVLAIVLVLVLKRDVSDKPTEPSGTTGVSIGAK